MILFVVSSVCMLTFPDKVSPPNFCIRSAIHSRARNAADNVSTYKSNSCDRFCKQNDNIFIRNYYRNCEQSFTHFGREH